MSSTFLNSGTEIPTLWLLKSPEGYVMPGNTGQELGFSLKQSTKTIGTSTCNNLINT
jgi:hypothetical protein